MRHFAKQLRFIALAAWIALVTVACRGESGQTPPPPSPPAPPGKVAIVGWDGAAWPVIDRLVREGRLPHLAGLLGRGSRAVLRAEPPMFSPVLWTTLATGFPPSEHGVTDFELPDPRGAGTILAATFHRKRAPLWQMASAGNRTVGFVGWWTTWPAEPVQGYVVSDHLAYNRYTDWTRLAQGADYQLTFPPGLAEELAPLAIAPESIDVATLTALVPFDAHEQEEMMAAKAPVKFHAPSVFRFGYATDASNARFAARLFETRGQPDLFAAVFVLTDVAGHVFWHHYERERFPSDPDLGRLASAIPAVYEQLDRWTGEILARLDPGTRVLVLSDHGMGAKGMLPHPGLNPAGDHTPEGILIAAGPGIPAGADLGTLSQLDFAPTVLAMLGLPVARDMPGQVIAALAGGIDPARTLESYGAGVTVDAPEHPSPGDEGYLERLRSLGYIR